MTEKMEISIVFNNVASQNTLKEGFGFAAWLQVEEHAVLLDTGSDGKILLRNMKTLGLDPGQLDAIVLSHDHWDHRDGLPEVLEHTPVGTPVYVPADVAAALGSRFPQARLVSTEDPVEVAPGVWTTGQVVGRYKDAPLPEHAVMVDTTEGLVVVAGCSHPGIERLLERVRENRPGRPVLLAAGGFHLRDHDAETIQALAEEIRPFVRHVAPSHCSGELARKVFREVWGEAFVELGLGARFSVAPGIDY